MRTQFAIPLMLRMRRRSVMRMPEAADMGVELGMEYWLGECESERTVAAAEPALAIEIAPAEAVSAETLPAGTPPASRIAQFSWWLLRRQNAALR